MTSDGQDKLDRKTALNRNMNKSKSRVGYNPPRPVPTIHMPLVAFQDGQGPPGQVFMVPRAVLIQDLYEGAAIPPWNGVAEQVLRDGLEARGIDPWYLPPARRIRRREAHVAGFFQALISWVQDDVRREATHRVVYEAIRRLPGQAWFEESEGNAAYLQLWCRGIVQGAEPSP